MAQRVDQCSRYLAPRTGRWGVNTDKETEDTNDTQIAPEPDYGVPDTGGIPDTAYAPLYGVPDTADSGTPSDDPDFVNGESVYNSVCMGCHSTNGVDIIVKAATLSDTELEDVITQGIGYMPPQSNLSPKDLIDVIAFIRSQ